MPKSTKFILLFSVLVIALCCTKRSQAQFCSDLSVRGAYGYSVSGSIVTAVGPLAAGPFAAVGRIVFDGNGHVSTVRSLSDDGYVLTNDSGTGTYVVNSDCTGSFNITVGPPGHTIPLTLSIVLDGTDQIRGIVTTPGIVLLLEGRRILSF